MDLKEFESAIEGLGVLGIRVSQGGELIAQRSWDEECRRNIYSASKSVTSCAVGFAVQEGLVKLSEKLVDAFPDDLPAHVGDCLAAATVRDLLTMCLGQREAALMGGQRPLYAQRDWVKLSLALPFEDAPGTKFVYNNVGPYLAGVLVQRRAGCTLVDYLTPRLFAHMGIQRPTWETDPQGMTFGAGGLFWTLTELHAFGQFCLQRGAWNGRQLLDGDWIDQCASKQVDNGADGYGYLFWRGANNSYRADGKYGQLSIVFPDRDAVISAVAECRQVEKLMDAIHAHLVPQL
ncbi:MAG TPA: serine hydrolase [Candidatus Faecivicinus avistercoris]|nr:serine hydrolase [Candidatus Faecivicinus avistercoris]